MSAAVLLVVLVLAAGDEAPSTTTSPPATEGQRWSVVGGRTLGAGGNAVEASLGWPGLSVGYRRGVLGPLDVGARLTFDYALEGLPTQVAPVGKVQGLLRLRLLDAGAVSLGLTFEPGALFTVDRFGNGVPAVVLPLGLKLGYAVSSALSLGASFDAPLWVQLGAGGGLNVPLLPGLGVEYFLRSELVAFFRARMGPTLRPSGGVELALDAQLGVAYRL
ncbi:MAG: hypothetical protein INH41_31195 [Myxococcaceae bacterium]|jgi:hypothetical protein|nr:hypothetical protein [Myxococcaceae bacterium]MCA3016874.1 hypothetical protein [Myxococcaceae bacterium]